MRALAVPKAGLVTGVGLDLASSCAAIRCGLTGFKETRFVDEGGEPILGAEVPLEQPWRGRDKLVRMAAMAIEECIKEIPAHELADLPLLLVVSEPARPGRPEGLDSTLLEELGRLLRVAWHQDSALLARGSVGGVEALLQARTLLERGGRQVLVAGVDSLLSAATLRHYESQRLVLTGDHRNGFIPGEGAAAVLLEHPRASEAGGLFLRGAGMGREPADLDAERPLRGDGLCAAIRAALADAGLGWTDVDYRLTDLSGDQRAFKEAALAITRLVRQRKEAFPLWHAGDCVGEIGAAVVPCAMAVALMAARKGYAPGPGALCHFGSADGRRGALVLRSAEGKRS